MKILSAIALAVALAVTAAAQGQGAITGRVVDPRGKGIAGAVVRALAPSGDEAAKATSDRKGSFRLDLAPGEYRLEFEAAGRPSASLRDTVVAEAGRVTKLKNKVELPELDAGSLIRGSVFTEEGRSIPGAKVVIERVALQAGAGIPAFTSEGASDRMGLFVFRVPEGEYRYRITASRSGFATKSTTVDVAGGETVNVAITLPAEK